MKNLKQLSQFVFLVVVLLTVACKKDKEECPCGYTGDDCTTFDPALVQGLLDDGSSPQALMSKGLTRDQIYGRRYNGGYVFLLSDTGDSGLLAALEDLTHEWGCYEHNIITVPDLVTLPTNPNTIDSIGNGLALSTLIANDDCQSNDASISAAEACLDLEQGGFDDWYLPSRGELNLLYENLKAKGKGDLSDDSYWTSDELDAPRAWVQVFEDGDQFGVRKDSEFKVRAIRDF